MQTSFIMCFAQFRALEWKTRQLLLLSSSQSVLFIFICIQLKAEKRTDKINLYAKKFFRSSLCFFHAIFFSRLRVLIWNSITQLRKVPKFTLNIKKKKNRTETCYHRGFTQHYLHRKLDIESMERGANCHEEDLKSVKIQ